VTASSGYLITQQKVLADSNAVRETELTELEARMERVEERYNRQFLAMQQIIDQMNSTKESMKSSFENLPFSNRD
jgi:flagellar capping protein FliD